MVFFRGKAWMHALAGLACALGSIACAVAALRVPYPVNHAFMADEDTQVVGIVEQGGERDVTFRLINASEALVDIVRVVTSCTCTRAEPAAERLSPGESTQLTAHLSVGNLRGKLAAHVDVLYRAANSHLLKRLPLTIMATIISHYDVSPEKVVFDSGPPGEEGPVQRAIMHD